MGLLAYDFMRNGFIACFIVALVCGAVGYFLVLRGEVFAGHALAHVAFPGAAGAVLVGLPPVAGLTAFTVVAGIGLSMLGERLHRDVAIGIVLSFSLGLGLLFLHFYTRSAGTASTLLFGNVLGISGADLVELALIGVVCLAALAAIARPLLFASLQPELAEAEGARSGLAVALFMVTAALAITAAIQIVGVLLVFALLVAPAAAASRLTRTVGAGVAAAILIALAISWLGLVFAFYTDWPTSFWITALGTAAYLASRVLHR